MLACHSEEIIKGGRYSVPPAIVYPPTNSVLFKKLVIQYFSGVQYSSEIVSRGVYYSSAGKLFKVNQKKKGKKPSQSSLILSEVQNVIIFVCFRMFAFVVLRNLDPLGKHIDQNKKKKNDAVEGKSRKNNVSKHLLLLKDARSHCIAQRFSTWFKMYLKYPRQIPRCVKPAVVASGSLLRAVGVLDCVGQFSTRAKF
jgi:hypothetical protein